MVTIAIVALESAHAVALERVWREEGHRVMVVAPWRRHFSDADLYVLRLSGVGGTASRFGVETTALSIFTRRAARLLRRLPPDVLIAFPGVALELQGTARSAVLLADDGHVRSHTGRLMGGPGGDRPLPERWIARLEAEYSAFPVVVPTRRMAADPLWGSVVPSTSAYGLPAADGSAVKAPDAALRFVTVGDPGWREGSDRLSRLADTVGVEYVTVVGAGGDVSDDLSPGLRFVGEQDERGTWEIHRESHAFVLLARDAVNAAAGLDALASGLPILVTEATGLSPFCTEGAGVVVADDASEQEYAAAVEHLRAEWSSMSQRARELAGERPWSAHASEILDIARGNVRVA